LLSLRPLRLLCVFAVKPCSQLLPLRPPRQTWRLGGKTCPLLPAGAQLNAGNYVALINTTMTTGSTFTPAAADGAAVVGKLSISGSAGKTDPLVSVSAPAGSPHAATFLKAGTGGVVTFAGPDTSAP
jgi:hypothetical protein